MIAGHLRSGEGAARRLKVEGRVAGDGRVGGDRVGQGLHRAVADVLGRRAVPGQVERVHPVPGGQRLLQEQPGVPVTPETVHQQHHVPVLAGARVADLPAADVDGRHLGAAGGVLRHAGFDHRAGRRDRGV